MPTDLVLLLVSAAIRACGLGLITFAGLFLFRIRSSAARHAAWTVVLIGMLLQIPLGIVAPTVPIKAPPRLAAPIQEQVTKSSRPSVTAVEAPARASRTRTQPKSRWVSSRGTITGVYLVISMLLFVRMAFASWRLRRILRDAKAIPNLGPGIFESDLVAAPGSVGSFRPRILLPRAWTEWDAVKRRAVLAHERAHVRRWDWLNRIASQVNVCIFWFHPLAWWMERELARLAEEACDDVAVSEIEDKEEYAAALVDIALAAAAHRRVFNWRVIAMANQSNAIQRVNRILSLGLEVPKPLGRLAWVTLFACSLPVIYLSSALKLASANRDLRGLDHALVRPADAARVIVDIRVHGNRNSGREVILTHVLTRVGDTYDQASMARDMNSLWDTGYFEDIRIEPEATPNGWIVHIYVKERSRLLEITPHVVAQKSSGRLIAQAAPDPHPRPASPLNPHEDRALAMCIIIDSSGSMDDKRDEVKAAALAFVKASRPHDKVCIVGFDDEVFNGLPYGEDFTSDIKEMEEALAHIGSRGGTAMRDAVQKSMEQVEQTAQPDRKVLVLVTDGYDTSSTVTQDQLLSKIKNSDVRVYSIGLLSEDPRRAVAARLALGQLAQASGGRDYYPGDLSEVESITPEIANEVRKQ